MNRKFLGRGIAFALTAMLTANTAWSAKADAPSTLTVPAAEQSQTSSAPTVNINQASKEEIAEALPGVGPVKAEAIVQYRQKNGPFKNLDDLEKVKGIGPAFIRDHKDKIGF